MRLRTFLATLAVTALLLPTAPAQAADVETIVSFNAGAGEFPEGLAVDKRDNVYVTLIAPISDIRRFTPDGEESTLVHFDVGGFGPLGMATDAAGNVFVAVASTDPATQGVYRVSQDGTATRLPGTEALTFANGLAFDKRGNLFVSDTAAGLIWRIPRGGSAEVWLDDPLLVGTGELRAGVPIGVNGIAVDGKTVVAVNTEQGTLLRIPIQRDGSAGEPEIVSDDPALFGADGIALDVHGSVYVAVNAQNTIVRVDGDEITTIADATDGINGASSVAFGTAKGDRKNLFVVNFGIFSPAPTPALLRFPVGVPGAPLP
jgi:sugar lactone lactonase YvrE